MKATEFDRALRDALDPAFQAAGFSAAKGGLARWSWSEAGRLVRVSLAANRRGWSEPWGSDFRVEVEESIDGENARRLPILEFLDVDGVREFCRLRNGVIDKGLARTPGDAAAGDAQREIRALDRADPPMPYVETLFPWFDADDLGQWAAFLAPRVAGLVPRLDQLAAIDPKDRRRALHDCWKLSDPRSDEQKSAHRALVSAALARTNAAPTAFGAAPTPFPGAPAKP